jgi:WD40 repeat protein
MASELVSLATPAKPGMVVLAKTGGLAGAVCEDGKLYLWALPEGRMLRTIDLTGRTIDMIVISEDGNWIAAGDHKGAYTVWNTATGAQQMHLQMSFYPAALAFSSDAKRLAIAPVGEPVQVYDPAAGRKLFELQRPVGGTAALAFSRDGTRIVAADADTVVRIYDARNGELLGRNTEFLMEPLAAAFSADGKHVLASGGDKFIAWLDSGTGRTARKSDKLADPVVYLDRGPRSVPGRFSRWIAGSRAVDACRQYADGRSGDCFRTIVGPQGR